MPIFASTPSQSFIKPTDNQIKRFIDFDIPSGLGISIDSIAFNDEITVIGQPEDGNGVVYIFETQTGNLRHTIPSSDVSNNSLWGTSVAINTTQADQTTGTIFVGNPNGQGFIDGFGTTITGGHIRRFYFNTASPAVRTSSITLLTDTSNNTSYPGYGTKIKTFGREISQYAISTRLAGFPNFDYGIRYISENLDAISSNYSTQLFFNALEGSPTNWDMSPLALGNYTGNRFSVAAERGKIYNGSGLLQTITRPVEYTVEGNFGNHLRLTRFGGYFVISDDEPGGNIYVYNRPNVGDFSLSYVLENPGYASYFDVTNDEIITGNKVYDLVTGDLIEQLDLSSESEYVLRYGTNYVFTFDGSRVYRYYRPAISRAAYQTITTDSASYNDGGSVIATLNTNDTDPGTSVTYAAVPAEDFDDPVKKIEIDASGTTNFTVNLKAGRPVLERPAKIFLLPEDDRGISTGSVSASFTTFADGGENPGAVLPAGLAPESLSVNEGESLTFHVITDSLYFNTILYWTSTNAGDSSATSGTVAIDSKGIGSFSLIPPADFTTDGTEEFVVELRSVSVEGTVLATSAAVTINDTSQSPRAQIFPDNLVVSEGKSIGFNVVTEFVPEGTVIYWTVTGASSADFAQSSGSMTVRSNRSRFTVTTTADFVTEGAETFQVQIRTGSTEGPVVATSSEITILDTSREIYSITAAAASVDEGSSLSFTVTTQEVPDGATLYWTADPSGEFAVSSGSFGITSNTGSFSVTPLADNLREGPETFRVSVRVDSVAGTVVATLDNILINDTSGPVTSVTVSPTSVFSGDTVTVTVQTVGVEDRTRLFYTVGSSPTLRDEFYVISNRYSFTFTAATDQYTNTATDTVTVSIRDQSREGTVLGSADLTLVDYTLAAAANNIDEGSPLTFTVTANGDIEDSTLYWTVATNPGDFSVASGSVTLSGGTGTFAVTPTADLTTEGAETFTVSLRSGSVSGSVIAVSGSVTINDVSTDPPTYTATPVQGSIDEGSPLTINVATTDVDDATTLYWTVTNSDDFVTASGSFTITSNAGSFTVTPRDDSTTEGSETFQVQIRVDSTSGTIVDTTDPITINDTSLDSPNAWNIAAAVFEQSYSVAAQENNPLGFFFKPDGTKMYVTGDQGDDVNEYDLATPWDISSGSVSFVQARSIVSAGYNFFLGLFFKPDGTKMYSLANAGSNSAIHEYDLSTPWDVSTLTYLQRKLVDGQDTGPSGVFFQADGLTMYMIGAGNDRVYQYTLATAWSVTSATFSQFFSVSAQAGDPRGLWFKPDGAKMYITSADGANDAVHEYDLGTPWDVTSAVYLQSLPTGAQDSYATGPIFRSDGRRMYIAGLGGDRVYQYNL